MVDTVCLHCHISKEQEERLFSLSERTTYETGRNNACIKTTTRILGLICKCENGELVIYGSLTKLALGDNARNATRQELIQGVERFISQTGVDIRKATISRLDLGACMQMERAACSYIDKAAAYPRKKRKEWSPTSVYFTSKNGAKTLCLYDKGKELRDQRQAKAAAKYGKRLLRVELRNTTTAAVRSVFRRKAGAVTLNHALSAAGWEQMRIYLVAYMEKLKFKSPESDYLWTALMSTGKEQTYFRLLETLRRYGGKPAVWRMLSEEVKRGRITPARKEKIQEQFRAAIRWEEAGAPSLKTTQEEGEFRDTFAAAMEFYKEPARASC